MKGLLNQNWGRFSKCSAALLALGLAYQASAQVVLHDADSTALIDPTSQAGMNHWDVMGQNELQQQWFWYGIGNGPVQSIDTIGAPIVLPKGPNEAVITYANPFLSVSVDYLLTGGTLGPNGYANADISESIRVTDASGNLLPVHFYQYSYFNLGGLSQDTVALGQNLMGQFNEATQTSGPNGLSETVTTPGAQEGEVAPLGGTLAKLNGGGPVTLGPPFFAGPLGPGAVTWALEWDQLLNPGGSMLISKDKYLNVLVPEPSTLALGLLGLCGLGFGKRRSRV